MLSSPLSDLASMARFDRQASEVRQALERAGKELSTGRREDLVAAAGGDPGRLLAIENEQTRALQQSEAMTLAQGRAGAAQAALGGLLSHAEEIGIDLQAALARGDNLSADLYGRAADGAFRGALETLNARFGGRALFAGADVNGVAIAGPEDILAPLRTLVAGAPDAATAIAAVEAWFDTPGGGYDTIAFRGATEDAPEVGVGDGRTVSISPRADSQPVRDLLQGLALAAVATEAGFSSMSAELLDHAAATTLAAKGGLIEARAELGLAEAAIEEAGVRAAARRAALDIAWNEATSRDPYEAASEFTALEQQLQSTFAVSSRLSRLTLLDFMR